MPDFDPFEPDLAGIGDWLIPRQDHVVEMREFRGIKVFLLVVADPETPPSSP